jgi:hypothetical protein
MAPLRDSRGRFAGGGGASFRVTGAKELAAKLTRMGRLVQDRMGGALYREANDIMTVSKTNHVPIDLGPLRRSGHVDSPERKGKRVTATMGFGGPTAAYAVVVHEHPSDLDPPSWRAADSVTFSPAGRGPKYLERPLMAAIPGMAERIGKALDIEDAAR